MRGKMLFLLLTGCLVSNSEVLAERNTEENRRRLAAKAERERREYHDIRPEATSTGSFEVGATYEADVKTFLSARAAPSSNSRELFRIYKGAAPLEIRGNSVMNAGTEWVPITVEGQQGWVAGHFLRRK